MAYKMEKLILFGTSIGVQLVYVTLSHDPAYEVVAFTVDRAYLKESTFCGLPVVPFEEVQVVYPPATHKMLVAIQANRMNKTRAEKYQQAREKGYALISYIHPQAIVAPEVEIGDNCFISEGAICRPYVKIGNDVIIMAGVTIGHHAEIQDHCFIGNRAVVMGATTVEPLCFIGPNATVLEQLIVRRECLIGGGVVIQENTAEKAVYKAPAPIRLPLTSDKMARIIFRKTL